MRLVDEAGAWPPRLARVAAVAAHGPLEEARAPIASEHAVVLAGGVVAADGARHVVKDPAWKDAVLRMLGFCEPCRPQTCVNILFCILITYAKTL